MIARWITSAWIVILAVGSVVVMVRNGRHITHYVVPQQLVQLVRQAHSGQPFKTELNIQVSPAMRDALCLPLTPQQLEMMRSAGEAVYSRSVSCHLISSCFKGNALTGVVKVSVQVHSKYSKNDLALPDTKLRIVVRHNGRQFPTGEWVVTEVEQSA